MFVGRFYCEIWTVRGAYIYVKHNCHCNMRVCNAVTAKDGVVSAFGGLLYFKWQASGVMGRIWQWVSILFSKLMGKWWSVKILMGLTKLNYDGTWMSLSMSRTVALRCSWSSPSLCFRPQSINRLEIKRAEKTCIGVPHKACNLVSLLSARLPGAPTPPPTALTTSIK